MSENDKYTELEIETIAARISAERAEHSENVDDFQVGDDCRNDLYQEHHHHSEGCLVLIVAMFGVIGSIVLAVMIRP